MAQTNTTLIALYQPEMQARATRTLALLALRVGIRHNMNNPGWLASRRFCNTAFSKGGEIQFDSVAAKPCFTTTSNKLNRRPQMQNIKGRCKTPLLQNLANRNANRIHTQICPNNAVSKRARKGKSMPIRTTHFFAPTAWLSIAAVLAALSGCNPSRPAQATKAAAESLNQPRESWEIYLLQGSRVGYGHTVARREVESGRDVLRTESVSHLALRRNNDVSRQEIRAASVETPGGRLLRFENEMTLGTQPIRTTGKVRGKRLEIETAAQDSRWGGSSTATPTDSTAAPTVNSPPPTRSSIAWSSDDLGPFAMEQSFLCKPMQPGERRTLKSLLVEFQQAVPIELTAKDYESTKLPSGPRELLRIETVTRLADGQKMEQTVWTDRAGEVLKTLVPIMGGLETYRVTQAEALETLRRGAVGFAAEHDGQGRASAAKRPSRRGRFATAFTSTAAIRRSVFVVGPTQAVKPIDAHTAEVTVYAIRPGRPRRQSRGAGRSADRRRSAAEQLRAERRSADRSRREEGGRRRDRPVARGGGARAVRQPRGERQEFQPGVRVGGRGGQDRARATAPSTRCS